MSRELEFVVRAVAIGVGGTLVMDLWGQLVRLTVGRRPLDLALLGRWLGHLPRGTFTHERIAAAEPVQGELLLGWAAHYGIGITFAVLLLAGFGLEWARSPTLWPALFIGVVTVVAPFFILQPALGVGVAASRAPDPASARLFSLLTHTAYGVGLYGAARLSALLLR